MVTIVSIIALQLFYSLPVETNTTVIVENRNLKYAAPSIKKDVERKFNNACILIVHGVSIGGIWLTAPDDNLSIPMPMQIKAYMLRWIYPDRPIVLWSCNPGTHSIKGKNIWYFKSNVWAIPDSQLPYIDSIRIYDFTSNEIKIKQIEYNRDDNSAEIGNPGSIEEAIEGS